MLSGFITHAVAASAKPISKKLVTIDTLGVVATFVDNFCFYRVSSWVMLH